MLFTSNKQIRGAYYSYNHGINARSLDEVYQSYSCAKENAWSYCKNLMKEYDGSGLAILGHNCMTFSVGFIGYINGLKHFFYITRDYDKAMPLEKMDEKTGEVIALS